MALRRESQSPGHCRAKLATGSAGVACVNCGRKVIRVVRLKDIKDLKAASIRLRREVQKKIGLGQSLPEKSAKETRETG